MSGLSNVYFHLMNDRYSCSLADQPDLVDVVINRVAGKIHNTSEENRRSGLSGDYFISVSLL
ncbi:MAG: hypothetical protein CVU40_09475 [Chloroflexi bacterium HGW-Chloroflexi-2]|nr:MAG: hypothetical protein CVU40_09475 [Chloroflexi bacterium HGW-Chloroflexi-2]